MLIINKVVFENFLSFYGEHEYEFEKKGIHWIRGINYDSAKSDPNLPPEMFSVASGKSSFTFVLQYGFFGEIEKDVLKDKIINKEAGSNLRVEVEFYNDNDLYKIKRYRKHDKFGDKVLIEMWVDGKWKNITSTKPQEQINEIIVINQATFLKLILYSREDKKEFFGTTTSERIKIFENIIQLNKFAKYLTILKAKLKKHKEELIAYGKQQSAAEASIKLHKKNIDTETEKKKIQKTNYTNQLKELKKENITDGLIKAIIEYNSLQEKLNKVNLREQDLLKKEYDTKFERTKKNCLNKGHIINDKKAEIENLEAMIIDSQQEYVVKCENCGAVQNQSDLDKIKESYINQIALLQESIKKLELEIIEDNGVIQECINKLDEINKEIKKRKTKADAIFERLKEIDLDEEYQELEEDEIDDLRNINSQIEKLEEKLEDLKNTDTIDGYKKDVKVLEKELKEIKEKQLVSLDKVNQCEWWIASLDSKNENSLKAFVVSKVIPVFNSLLQKNVDVIFENKVSITVDLLLNEKIIKNGEEYLYSEFSTGEKLQLNLCANLAIFELTRINLSGCSLVFFDEILNNVDEPTIMKFLKLFELRYAKLSGTYLISHLLTVKENITPKTITTISKLDDRSSVKKEESV